MIGAESNKVLEALVMGYSVELFFLTNSFATSGFRTSGTSVSPVDLFEIEVTTGGLVVTGALLGTDDVEDVDVGASVVVEGGGVGVDVLAEGIVGGLVLAVPKQASHIGCPLKFMYALPSKLFLHEMQLKQAGW